MSKLDLRTHPNVIFAYTPNHVDMIMRIENHAKHSCWAEAEVVVSERLSLSHDNSLRRGRIRIGIVDSDQYLEKSVKIYASTYTNPQMYRCKVTLYTYNKDGVIETRLEKPIDIRCENKKASVL